MKWASKTEQAMKCGEWILRANGMRERDRTSIYLWPWAVVLALILWVVLIGGCDVATAEGFNTEASYYTYASCIREGTSGIMANGKVLRDDSFIAASWDYKFGTKLRITRVDRKNLSCIVTVSDRGPSKKLYKRGRRIDLSLAAAKALRMVEQGLAQVTVEVIS